MVYCGCDGLVVIGYVYELCLDCWIQYGGDEVDYEYCYGQVDDLK